MSGTPHKHRDVIIAWANGEEVEYFNGTVWVSQPDPSWHTSVEWRIKPKRVKKEGWVNVYGLGNLCAVWATKKEADNRAETHIPRVACIRIEWEEEA